MKKTLSFLIVLLIPIFLFGCNGDDDSEEKVSETDFPENPIELIVPYDAGGGTDATARALASATEEHLDTSIGVDNLTGGGGAVGMSEGATADPDGYTVTLVTVELTILPHLGLAEFTHEDYRPIAQINSDPASLIVPADSQFDNIDDFLQHAEDNPEEVKVGNGPTGDIWQLASATLEDAADVKFNNVPFDGAAPAVTSLLGGHVDAVTVSPAEVLPQVEAGELKVLGVMNKERIDIMPDVPTFLEEGIDIEQVVAWRGVAVPKDTPDDVVKILSDAFMKGAKEEEFENFMESNGLGIVIKDSEEFKEEMEETDKFFSNLIDDLDLKP